MVLTSYLTILTMPQHPLATTATNTSHGSTIQSTCTSCTTHTTPHNYMLSTTVSTLHYMAMHSTWTQVSSPNTVPSASTVPMAQHIGKLPIPQKFTTWPKAHQRCQAPTHCSLSWSQHSQLGAKPHIYASSVHIAQRKQCPIMSIGQSAVTESNMMAISAPRQLTYLPSNYCSTALSPPQKHSV
jgi:hypothetical protein